MPVFSKYIANVQCHDFIHPWSPSCQETFLTMCKISFRESIKIYSVLYMISALVFKRKTMKLSSVCKNIVRSSIFLSLNGSLFIGFICLLRRALIFNKYTVAFIPAFIASLSAVLVENKGRRQQLAVYMANIATQTVFMMLRSRGFVQDIKCGETLIFGIASSCIMFLFAQKSIPSYLDNGLKFLFGKSEYICQEFDPVVRENSEVTKESKSILTDFHKYIQSLLKFFPTFKSGSCTHQEGCLSYPIQGFFKPFLVGSAIQYVLLVLKNIKKIVYPKVMLYKMVKFDNFRLGLFLGSFSIIFRSCQCLQKTVFKVNNAYFALASGFLAGLSKLFYPSTSLSMYMLSKAVEVVCQHYLAGMLFAKKFKHHAVALIYSLATAIVFHAVLMEPNNIPHAYLKFSERMSDGRLFLVNRNVLLEASE